MIDQTKNIMIGLFVIAACTIVVFILLFLHPTVGDEGRSLRVRFADIDKINIGTQVTYGGKAVGQVISIREMAEASDERQAKDGQVYLYELELQVDSSVNVFNSDEIFLRTSGLLGERSVAITPQSPKPDEPLVNLNEQVIYAYDVGSVEETFKEIKEVAEKVQNALDSITTIVDDMVEGKVVEKFANALESIDNITKALDQPDDWKAIITNVKDFTENLNDDLYLRFTSIMNKGEVIMDDINHYGLLFHLDKGWKRLRARRMNLVQKLCTPQEFRNYFNDEMDQITTSLSRVSMVLDKTECSPMWPCLLDDCDFRKVFSELIRRVEGMEEALKMYNEQLVECEVNKTELTCSP